MPSDTSSLPRPLLETKDTIAISIGIIVAIILFFETRDNPVVVAILLLVLYLAVAYVLWHLTKAFPWVRVSKPFWGAILTLVTLASIWTGVLVAYGRRVWPKRELAVHLIYKESPLWTEERREAFAIALDDYYLYLRRIGFVFPQDLPPIGFIHGNIMMAGSSQDSGVYYSNILISGSDANRPELAVRMYSSYIFNNSLLWNGLSTFPHDYNAQSAVIYACYFNSSFSNKNVCPTGWGNTQKWIDAMWDVRQQCGQDYGDRLMFYTHAMWKSSPPSAPGISFDKFFFTKLLSGESVIASPDGKLGCDYQVIVPKHGIEAKLD